MRKARAGRLARAAQVERHSVRSSLVKSSKTNPTRTGRQGVTQQSLNQPDEPLLPRLMSWSDTLAAVEEQSLETQVQRYKEWKRECISFRLLSPGDPLVLTYVLQEMDRRTKITAAFVKRTGEDLSLVQPAGSRSMPIVFQQVGCVIPKIHLFVQSASVAVGIPLLLHCHHRLHHRRKNGMTQHLLQLRLRQLLTPTRIPHPIHILIVAPRSGPWASLQYNKLQRVIDTMYQRLALLLPNDCMSSLTMMKKLRKIM